LIGIRHTWVFDKMNSAYITIGLDEDKDGSPDPGKLAEAARASLDALAPFDYYTAVKLDGAEGVLGAPSDHQATFVGERLTLRFLLPLNTPAQPKEMTLRIGDPTFFVAFMGPEGANHVALDGAPEGCRVLPNRQDEDGPERTRLLAKDIAAALRGSLNISTAANDDLKGYVGISCP
jgi:ABC-type uncharacterized transport system substrate-binding protein